MSPWYCYTLNFKTPGRYLVPAAKNVKTEIEFTTWGKGIVTERAAAIVVLARDLEWVSDIAVVVAEVDVSIGAQKDPHVLASAPLTKSEDFYEVEDTCFPRHLSLPTSVKMETLLKHWETHIINRSHSQGFRINVHVAQKHVCQYPSKHPFNTFVRS